MGQEGYIGSTILIFILVVTFFSLMLCYLKLEKVQLKDKKQFEYRWNKLGEKYGN